MRLIISVKFVKNNSGETNLLSTLKTGKTNSMAKDYLSGLMADQKLASKLTTESSEKSIKIIDELIEDSEKRQQNIFANLDFLKKAKQEAEAFLKNGYNLGKVSVLVPVGLWGLGQGFSFPDKDISLLGIGHHRYFLFHSAIGLVALRHFYKQWLDAENNNQHFTNRVKRKVSGSLLGSFAMGVGIHLAVDSFQPKSIVFPFFGSLVNGTLVDDNIWLIGNSLWAFKIGHDIFSLTMADELETAKDYVKDKFKGTLNFTELKVVK